MKIIECVEFRWYRMSFRVFLMSFWWFFLGLWWNVDELLMSFWRFIIVVLWLGLYLWWILIFFLPWWVFGGFWWVSDEFSAVSVELIWSDEFLMSFWWVFVISDEFRVFRFSTDSTKSQQHFNRNHRNSAEKKSPKLNRFNTDSTE